jgi:hypothetical protein
MERKGGSEGNEGGKGRGVEITVGKQKEREINCGVGVE